MKCNYKRDGPFPIRIYSPYTPVIPTPDPTLRFQYIFQRISRAQPIPRFLINQSPPLTDKNRQPTQARQFTYTRSVICARFQTYIRWPSPTLGNHPLLPIRYTSYQRGHEGNTSTRSFCPDWKDILASARNNSIPITQFNSTQFQLNSILDFRKKLQLILNSGIKLLNWPPSQYTGRILRLGFKV